jgi:hypothetical protein
MVLNSGDGLLLLAGLACGLAALAVAIVFRFRVTPAQRERRRLARLNALGRLGDASVIDVQGDSVYYTYSVSGVSYHASQDVSALRSLLPGGDALLFGHAYIKYLARNPANSMLLCEKWSGLRKPPGAALATEAANAAESASS